MGPGESSLTAMATITNSGKEASKTSIAPHRSNARLPFISTPRLTQGRLDSIDDMRDIAVRHAGIDRKRARAVEDRFRRWELSRVVAVPLLIDRMQMERHEMHGGADALSTQGLEDVVPADAERLEVELQ